MARDAQGKPIAGAKVWLKPVVTTGVYETRTDAGGRYQASGLPPVGYRAYAWVEREYGGKHYCLRLGHSKVEDYEPVVPTQARVRDFVLKTSGRIEDMDVSDESLRYFGGAVSVFNQYTPSRNAPVEFTLTPSGPLIDGSQGKILTLKPNANGFLLDVPVGLYKVKAVLLEGGKRIPVKVGTSQAALSAEASLDFGSDSSCVGSFGSGLKGAYLYWSQDAGGDPAPAPGGQTETWDGTLSVDGGSTYYVRYVFTLQQGTQNPSQSLYKGDFLECQSLSTACTKTGTGQGVRQDNAMDLVTTLDANGATFGTSGDFSGNDFSGVTNPVFGGKTASLTLQRQ